MNIFRSITTSPMILASTLPLIIVPIAVSSIASANTVALGVVNQDGIQYQAVKENDTLLRCGDKDIFYSIAKLKANTILETAGVSGEYTKVILPTAIGALVPIAEVDSVSGDHLTLKVDSKLLSPSMLLGLPGSWKGLYNNPFKAGTSLEIMETLTNASGQTVGYRVVAPKGTAGELPVAFVKTDALRDATADEIKVFTGQATANTKPTIPPIEPAVEPTAKPESSDVVDEQAQDAQEKIDMTKVDTSLIEPMQTEAEAIEQDTDSTPVEIENHTPSNSDAESQANSTKRTAPNGSISASQLEDLESAFDHARKLPRAELDEALPELLAEFTRTREQAEEDSSLAKALDQRIEWLKIRIESRDQRRAIAATLAAYDARADQLAQAIDAWQQGRAYQLVGKMMVSSVYTGEHLPLLYRIQAIDPATGADQTIGYVAPKPDQDFRYLLGRVVGVIGETTQDQSLKLKVIEPQRIDPMPE